MHLRTAALPVSLIALALAPGAASAAPGELPLSTVFSGTLTTPAGQATEACQASYRPGTPGVSTREITVPTGIGLIDATLDGADPTDGDTDLAIFDASGQAIASAASPDAQEVAQGWTRTGGRLRVQVCRRDGDPASSRVVIRRAVLPTGVTASEARADPPQLVNVIAPTRADRNRVASMGLDLTEHAGTGTIGVVLHGATDRARLQRAGLRWTVVVPDLVAQDLAARSQEARAGRGTARAGLPSGNRTSYRTLSDFESEMKTLAAGNPGLVRLITLPKKSFGGRDVMALEIATDVNLKDGRPGFVNTGVHHAREWPSGENAMEWAYELIKGVKSGDARLTKIAQGSRNFIVPIVNADGFNASRTAGAVVADSGRNEAVPDTAYLVAGATTGGEYRRKNCRSPDNSETAQCLTSAGIAEPGVDPNRNYGGLWGGPGATSDITAQTYWGPGPFSEPETQNVKALVGSRQIMTLITNHTTAGLLLRAPGIAALGDPVDENRGYKALGDEMALENGYFSQNSFELYDTTGTTEDWTYNTAGGFGFTFEVYCGAPNYQTGDCDDPAFHPSYARVIEEYEGTSPQADHKTDPGRSTENPFGNVKGYDGKGNREAYKIAAESAMNEARHAVLSGKVAPGTTLRTRKAFQTETYPGQTPQRFPDSLESSIEVGGDGTFRWAVNPSTRPIVAKDRGEPGGGTPSKPVTQTGGPGGSPSDPNDDGSAVPNPAGAGLTALNWNDHPFTVPATGDNRSATVRVSWGTPVSDYDITLYEDTNGNGKSDDTDRQIGTSASGATTEETVNIPAGSLSPNKKLVLRVVNFGAVENYTVTITYAGPEPFVPAQVEAYTLTCERDGQVLDTKQVTIDRGQQQTLSFNAACTDRASAPGATTAGNTGAGTPQAPGTTSPTGGGTGAAATCVGRGGFRSVNLKPNGRRVGIQLTRKISDPAQVSIFQQSTGGKITGERLVARFDGRTGGFTWNGKANRKGRSVRDGYFVVRFSIGSGATRDVRRLVLERRNGRFVRRSSYYRVGTCDALPKFKIERPVFGGRTNRPLNVSFRLQTAAKVTVTVLRGSRVVKRYGPTQRRAGITQRLRLEAKGLAAGDYRVRISVPRAGAKPLVSSLTARRV